MKAPSYVAAVGLTILATVGTAAAQLYFSLSSPQRVLARLFSFSHGASSSSSSSSAYLLSRRLSLVLPQIDQLKEIVGAAGASLGVASHGRTVLDHHVGLADVERGIVANASTRYTVGSLTKAFVAATLADLIDDQTSVLSGWGDNVADHIADLALALPDNHMSPIDMLAHLTGLSRIDPLWLGADGQTLLNKNDTVKLCNHLRPVYPVRSQWLYNNWMYGLAGELIERLDPNHRPWGDVVAERVLEPRGLQQTTVRAADLHGVPLAQPYMVLPNKTPVLVKNPPPMQDGVMGSAGGIRSTTSDLLKWGNGLLEHMRDAPSTQSHSALLNLFAGHAFINSSSARDELYGLGWAKATTPAQFGKIGYNPGLVKSMPQIGTTTGRDYQVFYHSGAIPGYNSCIMLVPKAEAVIVVLSNSISQGDIADWICQALLQAVVGEDDPVDLVPYAQEASLAWRSQYDKMKDELEAARTPGPHTEAPPAAALVGRYWHTTHALYIDVVHDKDADELRFSFSGKPSQAHTLTHHAANTFCFLPASDDERMRRGLFHYTTSAWLLEFRADSQGQFTQILWNIESQAPEPEKFVRQ